MLEQSIFEYMDSAGTPKIYTLLATQKSILCKANMIFSMCKYTMGPLPKYT